VDAELAGGLPQRTWLASWWACGYGLQESTSAATNR
jgi:hypothetical protein